MDAEEMKRRGRGISGDMSPRAIARRLDIVGELWRVWQMLRQSRRLGPVVESAHPGPAAGTRSEGGPGAGGLPQADHDR